MFICHKLRVVSHRLFLKLNPRSCAACNLSKILWQRTVGLLSVEQRNFSWDVRLSTWDGYDETGKIDLNPSRKARHRITQPVQAAVTTKLTQRQPNRQNFECDNTTDGKYAAGPDLMKYGEDDLKQRKLVKNENRSQQHTKRRYNHGLAGPGKYQEKRFSFKGLPAARGEFLFGIFPVLLALQTRRRRPNTLYMKKSLCNSDKPLVQKMLQLASELGIEVEECDVTTLNAMSQARPHQGVCLDTGPLNYAELEEDYGLEKVVKKMPQLWLLLDSIQDPMNFGAILRSSHFLGVDRVFTIKEGSCGLTPVVSKASAGAMEVMDIHIVNNLELFVKEKKLAGWRILGTVGKRYKSQKVTPLQTVTLQDNTILLLGNEGVGLQEEVMNLCDDLVAIAPGNNLGENVDSLNVSVAAGIILYHLMSTKGTHH